MSETIAEYTGLTVEGYRPQPGQAVDLVNVNKRMEEEILRVLDGLAASPDTDKRWLAIGRTGIEQAFMAINRAVFRPLRVRMVGDAP